jgi:tetratricopeptide (TPR) repeat protein
MAINCGRRLTIASSGRFRSAGGHRRQRRAPIAGNAVRQKGAHRESLRLRLGSCGDVDEASPGTRTRQIRRPVGMGMLAGTLGRVDESVALFRQALERDPLNPGVHIELGLALLAAGKLEAAEASFRKYLELSPGHNAHSLIARALLFRGEFEKAFAETELESHRMVRLHSLALVQRCLGILSKRGRDDSRMPGRLLCRQGAKRHCEMHMAVNEPGNQMAAGAVELLLAAQSPRAKAIRASRRRRRGRRRVRPFASSSRTRQDNSPLSRWGRSLDS